MGNLIKYTFICCVACLCPPLGLILLLLLGD
jgi:hypothetical protein